MSAARRAVPAAVVLVVLALPALSSAADYEPPGIGSTQPEPSGLLCPEAPEASESEDPVVVELRALRIDQAEACAAQLARLDELRARGWWAVSELHQGTELAASEATATAAQELLAEVRTDLEHENGLLVRLAQLPPLSEGSESIGSVTVSEAPTDGEVLTAVNEGTDTSNQNLWALAGLFCGFGLLMVLWRLLRP